MSVPSGIPGGTFATAFHFMTNQIALILGAVILIGLGIDYYQFEWSNTLFLARKLAALIEWLAFWR